MIIQKLGIHLKPSLTPGSQALPLGADAWRLEIPSGLSGRYRLAQLDDYSAAPRRKFPWRAPVEVELRMRASAAVLPGTWGFGLWNDPFGMAFLGGFEFLRLPALPNSVWFFFASPPNYLSFRDDLHAQGSLAATFRSPRWPAALLAPGLLGLPLLAWKPAVRLLRRLACRVIQQDAAALDVDVCQWHSYRLQWTDCQAHLTVDNQVVFSSRVTPQGPLGLVIWIDNQYAAVTPQGQVQFGALANLEPAWIEIRF